MKNFFQIWSVWPYRQSLAHKNWGLGGLIGNQIPGLISSPLYNFQHLSYESANLISFAQVGRIIFISYKILRGFPHNTFLLEIFNQWRRHLIIDFSQWRIGSDRLQSRWKFAARTIGSFKKFLWGFFPRLDFFRFNVSFFLIFRTLEAFYRIFTEDRLRSRIAKLEKHFFER